MITAYDIAKKINEAAPEILAEDFDNVGLLLGRSNRPVTTVLCCLDVDEATAREAREKGAQMIVSHHPVIFNAQKCITDETPLGRTLLSLLEGGIAVCSAHTNLDSAEGGLNDLFAHTLNLAVVGDLAAGDGEHTCGRVCRCDETLSDLAMRLKEAYQMPVVRYTGDPNRRIKRVALCTGGGRSLVADCLEKQCDVYISGDLSYNDIRTLAFSGCEYLEIGHFESEHVAAALLSGLIGKAFPELTCLVSEEKNILANVVY